MSPFGRTLVVDVDPDNIFNINKKPDRFSEPVRFKLLCGEGGIPPKVRRT